MDERDHQINRKALLRCWQIEWLYWCSCCMIPFTLSGLSRTPVSVRIEWLPMALFAAWIIHATVWSIVVLRMYGKDSDVVEEPI